MRVEAKRIWVWGMFLSVWMAMPVAVGYAAGDADKLPAVPAEYASKQMPKGWWTDPKVIAAGKKIYQEGVPAEDGKIKKCAKCHGEDAKPSLKGARDLRAEKRVNRFSEAYWFWVIHDGVPKTKMKGWEKHLTEEQIWQVMAYEHMFSHGGKMEAHNHPEIERSIASK